MNFKLIAIAAAAASLAGTAHADLTSGTVVNNGSVTLLAVDITTLNWYIRDTGFLLNDFMPSTVTTLSVDGGGSPVTGNKTPNAGLTLDKTNTTSFADSSFSGWVASTTGASNVRWVLSGYDLSGTSTTTNVQRLLSSSANANQTIQNGQVTNFVGTGNSGGLFNFFNPSANEFSVSGSGGANGFLSAWGLGVPAMASLDQAASLFYAARNPATGASTTQASITKFGNTTGFANVKLESNGDFSYVLAAAPVGEVPLPAAVWMMGAGLAAVGSVVRRRRAAAQA